MGATARRKWHADVSPQEGDLHLNEGQCFEDTWGCHYFVAEWRSFSSSSDGNSEVTNVKPRSSCEAWLTTPAAQTRVGAAEPFQKAGYNAVEVIWMNCNEA